MYNFKKLFTYMVVGALVMALSISCKNEETNPNTGKFKHSDLVGTWTGDAGSFTINSSGYVNFTYQSTTYNDNILGYFEGGWNPKAIQLLHLHLIAITTLTPIM